MRWSSDMALARAPAAESAGPARLARWRRRMLFLVPAIGFLGLVIAFTLSLDRDPSRLPSTLLGQPVPEFRLPPVEGRTLGLASADLKGDVSLVNVFASWCVACREEHPLLMRMKGQGLVPIHGLNSKDKSDDAPRWLHHRDDPYTRTGADLDGRGAIAWGVYGVPETLLVERHGRFAFKPIVPVST